MVDVLVLIESETTCSVAGEDGLDLMTTLGKAMLLYVILTLIRGTSTFVMKPFMRQKSKQFDVTYKEVLVSKLNDENTTFFFIIAQVFTFLLYFLFL